MTSSEMPITGENFAPELDGVIRLEHLHRYFLANDLVQGKDVLDIACGEGYGSAILGARANSVVGVDISPDAIAHARANYAGDKVTFHEGSAIRIPLDDSSVDVVVSFDTIEHLAEHEMMLSEMQRVLRKDGTILISSPNKAIFSDRTGSEDPSHVKELQTEEFIEILSRFFPNLRHFGQKLMAGSVIASDGLATPLSIFAEGGKDNKLDQRRYDLIVASAGELPSLNNSVFEVPESPLDPYEAEAFIASYQGEPDKLVTGDADLRDGYNRVSKEMAQLKVEYGQLMKDAAKATERAGKLEGAMARISRDAHTVINSKYWKRTKFQRRLSNSMRKLRGRPKKTWPENLVFERYLEKPEVTSEAPKSVKAEKLDLIPFHGRSQTPHLTCVSMVRNEALRADDMMRHLCALFDRVVVIDHLSTDGTAEIVARYDGHAETEVVIISGMDEGYYQSEYMTAVTRALSEEARSDWLFFLDFDEILPFRSRDIFLQALVPLTGSDVIHSNWYNLASAEEPQASMQGAEVTIGPKVSRFTKVALNLPRLKGRMVKIAQGNHAAHVDGKNEPYLGERAFGLMHLPINGRDAFRAKLEQGARAYELKQNQSEVEGSHWRELLANFDGLWQDPIMRREVALRYGEPLEEILSDVKAGRLTEGARPLHLSYAQTEPAPDNANTSPRSLSFSLPTMDAVMALAFPNEAKSSADTLEPLSKAVYETLPPKSEPLSSDPMERAARVHHSMIAAATEIEVLTLPTAWSGHKAFLFSLMEAMRPRRYVELGTHAGASFFAACQHFKMNGGYGEGVAVDIWEGDHQAGFYDERVFNNFKHLLNKHFPKNGSFIRGYFSEAVKLFEPGSIDLLHIDGLHTYEAVKEDFETWRPKLSDNGTIIFHDTSEYQTDFGVWQLFEELQNSATASFRFRHCHGLGVLAFGDSDHNPAIELLEHLSVNPALSESYYATLGSSLFDQALRRTL